MVRETKLKASRWLGLLGIASLLVLPSRAQQRLTGDVELGLQSGIIRGDLCLRELSGARTDTLFFLLHHGMNIRSVTDDSGRAVPYGGHFELSPLQNTLRYGIPGADTLQALCISYTGAYPVYTSDESALFDYQERIAFNGETVRAAASTAWYPVPYEPATGVRREEVAFQLRIRCSDCRSIYVNGSTPKGGPVAELKSGLPRPLLLFAGDYDVTEAGGVVFLNSAVTEEEATTFGQKMAGVQELYEEITEVPFGDTLVYLHHESVARARFRGGRVWGFVSYPTMAYAGIDFGDFALALADTTEPNPAAWGLLAHEAAHYYFGTLLRPSGPYQPFYTESFADYLGLKAVERFVGRHAYQDALRSYYAAVAAADTLAPLHRADREMMGQDAYRYRYGPLLLVALEHAIGQQSMRRLLNRLVSLPEPAQSGLDYDDLRRLALEAGVGENTWAEYEAECVLPEPRKSCLRDMAK